MVPVFALVASILAGLLAAGVTLYLIVLYAHPEDQGFGSSWLPRLVLLWGFMLCWGQVILTPLDVSWQGMPIWQPFYWIYLSTLVGLVPFTIFLYESDDDRNYIVRMLGSLIQTVITLALVVGITLPLYYYFGYSDLQVPVLLSDQYADSNSSQPFVTTAAPLQASLSIRTNPLVFLLACALLLGYIVVMFCGGCGLTALPLDLLLKFKNRAVVRSSNQARVRKQALGKRVQELLNSALQIRRNLRQGKSQEGWWNRRQTNSRLERQLAKVELALQGVMDEHQLFLLELSLEDSNPLLACGEAFLGVILGIFSLFILAVVLVTGVLGYDILGILLSKLAAGSGSFLCGGVAGGLAAYLLLCVLKGNFMFGVGIPWVFTVHAMRLQGTWMNSFLFNLEVCLLASSAVLHLTMVLLQAWMRWSALFPLFTVLAGVRPVAWFFGNKICFYGLFIWGVLALPLVLYRNCKTPSHIARMNQLRRKAQAGRKQGTQLKELLTRHEMKYFRQ